MKDTKYREYRNWTTKVDENSIPWIMNFFKTTTRFLSLIHENIEIEYRRMTDDKDKIVCVYSLACDKMFDLYKINWTTPITMREMEHSLKTGWYEMAHFCWLDFSKVPEGVDKLFTTEKYTIEIKNVVKVLKEKGYLKVDYIEFPGWYAKQKCIISVSDSKLLPDLILPVRVDDLINAEERCIINVDYKAFNESMLSLVESISLTE